MDKLQEARGIINEVDAELARLFERRMEAARMVAAYKKEHGLPVLDAAREAEVIEQGVSRITDESLKEFYSLFLKNTMRISRAYQQQLLSGMRVAYSGVEGAFAHIAAGKVFPEATLVGHGNFHDAYQAVEKGVCDAAVLPIENSSAGEVGAVTDLLFSGNLFVSAMYDLAIVQDLLVLPGTRAEDVREVVSHPQALAQCAPYIREHGYLTRELENTALAAKCVSESGRHDLAAIASAETAELYGLCVLDHNLNQSTSNTTRFAVFTRTRHKVIGHSGGRFILVFTVSNEAGSLVKALDMIGKFGFNMRTLRSRPMKDLLWQYYFYVELEGNVDSDQGRAMLAALSQFCDKLKVCGSFSNAT